MSWDIPKRNKGPRITKCEKLPDGSIAIEGVIPLIDGSGDVIVPGAIDNIQRDLRAKHAEIMKRYIGHNVSDAVIEKMSKELAESIRVDIQTLIDPSYTVDQKGQPLPGKSKKYIKNDNPHLPKEYIDHVLKSVNPEEYFFVATKNKK